jgi:ABC-type branched-subunit amino acid transport system ATPase component
MTETGTGTAGREAHLKAAEGAVLRADELIAGYMPEVNILNGSDLYCQENELVGIIGPNGAGKSTLLKAMFGLVKVSSGTVTLKGQDITNQRADALVTAGIGFVPQNNNVFPSLTIAENLEMGVFQAPKTFANRFAIGAASAQARSPAASARWWPWDAP